MRYFFIGFAVLLFIIFGIVIFSRSTSRPAVIDKGIHLSEYLDNGSGSVRWTQDGPISASETHHAIRVTVGPQTRTIDVLTGYEGQVTRTETLPNNSSAYGQFLAALDRVGYTRSRRSAYSNFTAVCPLSSRTTYEVFNGASTDMRTWSAPCVNGTFAGSVTNTASLFRLQIPDYSKVTSGINVTGASTTSVF